MYCLAIVKDLACRNRMVLKKGSYSDLSIFTSKFNNSDEIRKEFPKIVSEFEYEYRDSGHIVIYDDSRMNNDKYDHPRIKVLYKADVELFNNLLEVPELDDSYYNEWIEFWRNLKYDKESGNKYLFPEELDDEYLLNFYEKVNNKIRKQNHNFSLHSFNFTSGLFNLSSKYCDNWNNKDISDKEFIDSTFIPFINRIKADGDLYYKFVNIVSKAYKIYKDRSDFIKEIEEISSIKDSMNQIDTHNMNHSQIYNELYSYIASQDAVMLNEYINTHPNIWLDLTKEEAKEIKSIIKPTRRIK